METLAFTILDIAADTYLPVFFFRTHAEAKRAFSNTINSNDETQIQLHPNDFNLCCIGSFDDTTAELIGNDGGRIIHLGNGVDFIEKKQLPENEQPPEKDPRTIDIFDNLTEEQKSVFNKLVASETLGTNKL